MEHCRGLRAGRAARRESFARATAVLLERLHTASSLANSKVLLNPFDTRNIVKACNQVGSSVEDFRDLLGLDRGRQQVDARRWRDAAVDVRDRVLETGAGGVDNARRFGIGTLDRARAASEKVAGGIMEAAARRRKGEPEPEADTEGARE